MPPSHADGSPSATPRLVQVKVLRIAPGQSVHVRTLSPRIGGLMTHYVRNRSYYCAGEDCSRTLHAQPMFWKGYAAVEMHDRAQEAWIPFVLEVTEHAEQDMRDIYARGQGWHLSRQLGAKGKYGPVEAALVKVLDASTLPLAFDVHPVLCHLFHVYNVQLDKQNPLPSRLVLPPSPFITVTVKEGEKK